MYAKSSTAKIHVIYFSVFIDNIQHLPFSLRKANLTEVRVPPFWITSLSLIDVRHGCHSTFTTIVKLVWLISVLSVFERHAPMPIIALHDVKHCL